MTDLSAVLASGDQRPFSQSFAFQAGGMAHPVLVEGEGPAVILMHEISGFLPQFWRLARWIAGAGFTVYAPALYEDPGTPVEDMVREKGTAKGTAAACISREIHLFAANHSSPLTRWLRALADEAHTRSGGPGVGVVGLCMTGNFAWSLAVDAPVEASVAAEPALPFHAPGALSLSPSEKQALAARDLPLMALRFAGDPACRPARFDALREVVGASRLIEKVLPDAAKNPKGSPFPHAVLTKDLIAEDGEPTLEAAREVLGYLRGQLAPAPRA